MIIIKELKLESECLNTLRTIFSGGFTNYVCKYELRPDDFELTSLLQLVKIFNVTRRK